MPCCAGRAGMCVRFDDHTAAGLWQARLGQPVLHRLCPRRGAEMKTLIAIPARYASTRYPGKPLVTLRGPDGEKTLIRRSWEAAMAVRGIDRVVVATDDARIADHAAPSGPRW